MLLQVRYTASDFVSKNIETLSNQLKDLGGTSSSRLLREIFNLGGSADDANAGPTNNATETPSNGSSRRSTIRGVSIGSQFRSSLQQLVSELEQTMPHYVRCIKPNLIKKPNALDSAEVLRQLRYSGMMEAIRIRHEGYALREDHEGFYARFCILLDSRDRGKGIVHLVQVLSQRLKLTDAEWQIGHSRIFLRYELSSKLEILVNLRIRAAARVLKRFGRNVAEQRAAKLLTAWAIYRIHRLRKYYAALAAAVIAASFRKVRDRKRYLAKQFVAVKMQSHQRRKAAVIVAENLRDPYRDLAFKELEVLLLEKQVALDRAVEAKNFVAAASIEADMYV